MPVQIGDDAVVRNLAYNSFNELKTDSLVADSDTHLVTELHDNYGRSVGYTYAKNGSVQQTVSTSYGSGVYWAYDAIWYGREHYKQELLEDE